MVSSRFCQYNRENLRFPLHFHALVCENVLCTEAFHAVIYKACHSIYDWQYAAEFEATCLLSTLEVVSSVPKTALISTTAIATAIAAIACALFGRRFGWRCRVGRPAYISIPVHEERSVIS